MRLKTSTPRRRSTLPVACVLAGCLAPALARAESPSSGAAWGEPPPAPPSSPQASPKDGPSEAAHAELTVAAERPYRLGARPRAQGAVQASVADEDVARWNVGGSSDPGLPSNHPGFHPAPRVLVDVNVRSGTLPKRAKSKSALSEASLVAQIRNAGYWPFRLCYEDGLRRDSSLRGKTRVRLTVEASGRVNSERMAFTELKDHSVAKCLSARVRALHFSPAPPKRVHADITVDLNPGDAPLPDGIRRDAPVGSAESEGGKLDETAAARALDGRLAAMTSCYEQGLGRDPKLWGRVAILMDVDGQGRVLSAAEIDSHFPDKVVLACAFEALRGTSLPPPVGGPARVVWAVKLGSPPPQEPASGRTGSVPTPGEPKRTVAEAGPPRVPVAK